MPASVRIVITGDRADVYSPYEARGIVKEVPGRRWDAERKVWTVPRVFVEELVSELKRAGYAGSISGIPRGHAESEAPRGTSWATTLFDAVPERLHKKVFEALTRVLHPDVGGDLASMQVLTQARDLRR